MSNDTTTKFTETEARQMCVERCTGTCLDISARTTPEETAIAVHAACWNWKSFLNYKPPVAIVYEPCPNHPELLLPVTIGDTSKYLCPACGQAARRETYAEQKADPKRGLMRIPLPPPVRL